MFVSSVHKEFYICISPLTQISFFNFNLFQYYNENKK